MRRRLGPTAWVVLETLLARSTGPDERCEAIATTRTLAKDLGLAKDTVARALVKLRRAGVVTACQTRAAAGTFTTGSYVIVVPNCFILDEQSTAHPPPPSTTARRARSAGSSRSAWTTEDRDAGDDYPIRSTPN